MISQHLGNAAQALIAFLMPVKVIEAHITEHDVQISSHAIPSSVLLKVSVELRSHGTVERAWLGVRMQPETQARAIGRDHADGALVITVQEDPPTARADIKQGDLILAFNGTAVRNRHATSPAW